MLENFEDKSDIEYSNEWALAELAKKLDDVRVKLARFKKVEDFSKADEEDDMEAGEERNLDQEMKQVLLDQEQEILGSMSWIKEHGDACAFPGCKNKVSAKRREADPASITCSIPEHMESEDALIRDIVMGL